MARGKPRFNPRKARRNVRRAKPAAFRSIGRMSGAQQNNRGKLIGALKFGRTLLTGFLLPKQADIMKVIYNVFLSYVQLLTKVKSYVGCLCSFEVTPGSLLKDSPLLATISQSVYSFPAIPVKTRHIKIRITNTTKLENRAGKWAAVYIPYRELHDAGKYSDELLKTTYSEMCQMPNAKSGNCNQDLVVNYRPRDKSDYCARARELDETIGILAVAWECYDRLEEDYAKAFDNTEFSCEFEISGTIDPLVTFGPKHRKEYSASVFEPKPVTKSEKALTILNDGLRFYGSDRELTDYLDSLMEPGE